MAEIESYRAAAAEELRAGNDARLRRDPDITARFEGRRKSLADEFDSKLQAAADAEDKAREAYRDARSEHARLVHEKTRRTADLDKVEEEELRPYKEEAEASRHKVAAELETKLKQAKQRLDRALEGLPKHT